MLVALPQSLKQYNRTTHNRTINVINISFNIFQGYGRESITRAKETKSKALDMVAYAINSVKTIQNTTRIAFYTLLNH